MFLFAGERFLSFLKLIPATICEVMFLIDRVELVIHCMKGISTTAMDETFWCWIVEGDNPLVEQPLYIGT